MKVDSTFTPQGGNNLNGTIPLEIISLNKLETIDLGEFTVPCSNASFPLIKYASFNITFRFYF